MLKIGLQHNAGDDFDHPKLDDNSPLKRHVFYLLSREEYIKGESSLLKNIVTVSENKAKKV